MKKNLITYFGLSFIFLPGLFMINSSASARTSRDLGNFTVTVGVIPACNKFVPAPISVSGSVNIWQGTVIGQHQDPFASVPSLAGISPYVSLTSGGKAVYKSPKPTKYLRILWGTIDPNNSATFFDSSGAAISTITGADLIANGISAGNRYLIFRSLTPFSTVELSMSGTAFEYSDLSFSGVVPQCP